MKKDKGILLSHKHGVNPSMLNCPVCGDTTGIALHGRLKGDVEARKVTLDLNPCDKCKASFEEYEKIGFSCFVVMDEYEGSDCPTPWPFFHSVQVIKMEAAERMFQNIDLSKKACFMPLSVAKQIGLIKEEK